MLGSIGCQGVAYHAENALIMTFADDFSDLVCKKRSTHKLIDRMINTLEEMSANWGYTDGNYQKKEIYWNKNLV